MQESVFSRRSLRCCAVISSVIIAAMLTVAAHAQTILSGYLTVDNAFNLYISTSDEVAGTLVLSGSNWPQTFSFSATLNPGQQYYLHIEAVDYGPPAAFIGSFALNNTGLLFANGTQSLITEPTAFLMSTVGFGVSYTTPISAGFNGVYPWGGVSGIDSNAQWLSFSGYSTVFFSAPLQAVPEPGTLPLLLVGVTALAFMPWRKCSR